MSRTCKALKNAVSPRLYSKLVLKVPQSWSQLESFEYLLASSGEGLQYTTCVRITTLVGPMKPTGLALRPPSEPESAVAQQIYYPDVPASIHFNALVRILIRQLPKQHITEFMYVLTPKITSYAKSDRDPTYSWDHGCICDRSTIDQLLETQELSLTTLSFDQICYASSAFDHCIRGLQSLSVRSLESDGLDWLWCMTYEQTSLKHLTLGAEIDAIQRFYRPGSGLDEKYDLMLEDFMMNYVDNHDDDDYDDDRRDYFLLTSDSFGLIGLSVDKLFRGPSSLLDFSALTSLSLEDCWGVEDFFTVIQNANNKQGVKTQSLLRLRSFHLRHNSLHQDTNIRASLLAFLTSIPGLTNLSILLQANERPPSFRGRNFGNVLLTHGKTLRTLVWEERITCRESYVERSNARFPSSDGLVEIAQSCNNLVELSIPIDWSTFGPIWGSSAEVCHRSLLTIRNRGSWSVNSGQEMLYNL